MQTKDKVRRDIYLLQNSVGVEVLAPVVGVSTSSLNTFQVNFFKATYLIAVNFTIGVMEFWVNKFQTTPITE